MAKFIGPYEVLENYGARGDGVLGTGGMGTVYAVRHGILGQIHALKVLHPGLSESDEFNRRFAREARIMCELGEVHPNILAVTDFRENDEGATWLRMPLVEGIANDGEVRWVTLAERMEAEGQMELNVVKEVTGQILSAVEYAHGEGVLHRDLKPANTLLTKQGILLADFGLARAVDAGLMRSRLENSLLNSLSGGTRVPTAEELLQTMPDTKPSEARALLGTLAYMAPELKPPKCEEHSEQSDLYAIGLLAWQMLTGEGEPGMGESASGLRGDISEDWDQWLSRALARRREKRFASVREMRESWESLVGREREKETVVLGREPEAAREITLEARVKFGGNPASGAEILVEGETLAVHKVEMEGSRAGERREFGGMAMQWCPPGEFWMGSPEEENGRRDDELHHRVQLTTGFWLARTACTQSQWEQVMRTNVNEQSRKENAHGTVTGVGSDYPIYFVSWGDAQEWLKRRNEQDSLPGGWEWVLPTEAQWEYACRAGSRGAYGGTGNLDEMGWHAENGGGTTRQVGAKKPNAWGMYDMHGNVWEWCSDWYGGNAASATTNPESESVRTRRVIRGGSWSNNGLYCRSSLRSGYLPARRYSLLGFRPAIGYSR